MLKYLLPLLLLQIQISYSQSDSSRYKSYDDEKVDTKYAFGFKTEYSYQHSNFIGFGFTYLNPSIYQTACANYPVGLRGLSLTVDLNLNQQKTLIIPKVSYEATFLFFTGKLNVGVATNFNKENYLISPEIGLSALGFLYVLYGYNFTLNSNDFNLQGSKITVGLNINPRVKWKDGYKCYIWQ